MNQQFKRILQVVLLLMDLAVIPIVYFTCYFLLSKNIGRSDWNIYFQYTALSVSAWILFSFLLRIYTSNVVLQFESFTRKSSRVYLLWIVVLLLYLYFSRDIKISRLFIFLGIIGFGAGLLVNRFLYLGVRKYFKFNHHIIKKVIILGYNKTAKRLARYFEEDSINTELLGFIEDDTNVHELSHYPIMTDISKVLQVAKEHGVDEIYSTITPEQNPSIYDLMYEAEHQCIRFKIVPNLSVFIKKQVHIEYFGDLPILSLRTEPLDDVGNRVKKRFLDIIVSFFVIVCILSWLIPLMGLLIKLESRGPVFFIQKRTGKNRKSFRCLKFRSMKVNKDSDLKQATQNDTRVTAIGRFIRKTSLDEFPQFLNVFKGEMSLVGPRPHMIKHTTDYSKVVDDYMVRQFIKPGITGWAQINGYRGEITNEDQIKLRVNKDLWYLENWSLWLDVQILFLTIYHVIKENKNTF